jgi:dimethylhistidine N-methyltransferase
MTLATNDNTERGSFLTDVLLGLAAEPRAIPGKYLWNQTGSAIFDTICRSGTYYPAVREIALLKRCVSNVAHTVGPDACIVEFGSGSSHKTRLLLDAMKDLRRYIALDISGDFLGATIDALQRDYPKIECVGICADYSSPLPHLPLGSGSVVGFFPGNSIGNMDPAAALDLLFRVKSALAPAWLFIGQDPNRDGESLGKAYGSELMAKFHRNLLTRIADELGAEVTPEDFAHKAHICEEPSRVEARLVAKKPTVIKVVGRDFHFAPGSAIRTDVSRKYTPAEFERLLAGVGWDTVSKWMDPDELSALYLLHSA